MYYDFSADDEDLESHLRMKRASSPAKPIWGDDFCEVSYKKILPVFGEEYYGIWVSRDVTAATITTVNFSLLACKS